MTQFLHCYFQNKSTFLNLVSELFSEEAQAAPQEVQPSYAALAICQLRKTSGGPGKQRQGFSGWPRVARGALANLAAGQHPACPALAP